MGPTGGDQEQPLVSSTCGTLLHTESGQTLLALSLSEITPRKRRYVIVPIIHLHGPREQLRGSQANSQAGVEVTAYKGMLNGTCRFLQGNPLLTTSSFEMCFVDLELPCTISYF